MKPITVKPVINKKNHQINISLPKKKLPKEIRDNIMDIEKLKFYLEGF